MTKTIKSVILAETDIRTYIWEADYDSWNRINTMTYPDGEVVTYMYDKGGNLNSITTEKDGDKQTLIAEQRYDKYGNLTYRKMGNGTETKYDYDEKRLHLNAMSLTSNGVKMMENVYKYDNVDNILGISNAAAPSGEIGGTYSHSYQYDELNRLVSASGTAKDKNYELLMRYDVMSNPLQKDSVSYEYNTPNHPNAVSSAGNKIFSYDANGNPISVEDTTANTLRVMQWDEENRLQSLGDDGYVSRYTYNHAGERVIKSHGPTTVAFVNGAPQGILWHDKDNWTMYVSPYMVVNSDRFTKHYYAGSQRIASKIGVGDFNNLYDASKACVTAGQKDYAERLNLITQSRNDYYAALGIPPGPPTAKGIYGEAEYSGVYGSYTIKPLGNYDVPTGWPMKPYKRPYGGTPGPPVMYEKPSDPEDEGAGYGYSNGMSQQERDVFYYHSDHLGSTSYITDRDGNASQFVCYKPYGEALVDVHNTSYEQPWKFNGKELDSETGLYYYGARYYEPVLALWYGVDALTEKYPSMGGYVYCAGNPVKLVDVDGNQPVYNENGELIGVTEDSGLQGDALFMKNEEYDPKMSIDEAIKKNRGISFLKDKESVNRYEDSFKSLNSRPDWDGYLTLDEANEWYRNGNGQPLYVSLEKINLDGLVSLGEDYVGKKYTFNLLYGASLKAADGLVYGNLTFKRYPNHTCRAYADTYDFDYKSNKNPANWIRNIETFIGKIHAGEGKGYQINIYGSKKITPILPWIK